MKASGLPVQYLRQEVLRYGALAAASRSGQLGGALAMVVVDYQ
jgi:hypothetical protein